jgi:hypothetical protein
MQGYWEEYIKIVDAHPAMISLNVSVSEDGSKEDHGYVAFVKVKLNTETEDGFISKNEINDISFIEDRLELECLRYRHGQYVGRVISQGSITFIYYLKLDFEWSDTVNGAMSHFEGYSFEIGSRMDSEWEVYEKLLFPTAIEWQVIHNHHACDELSKAGDNLTIQRAIEHTSYFKNPQEREIFSAFIVSENFKILNNIEPSVEAPDYGVKFYRVDIPFYHNIDTLTLELIEQSLEYNGQYDGWETSLVK